MSKLSRARTHENFPGMDEGLSINTSDRLYGFIEINVYAEIRVLRYSDLQKNINYE